MSSTRPRGLNLDPEFTVWVMGPWRELKKHSIKAFVYVSFAAVVLQVAFGFASMIQAGDAWQQREISRAILGALFGMVLDGICLYLLAVRVYDRRRREQGCECYWDGWSPRWCYKCVNGFREL